MKEKKTDKNRAFRRLNELLQYSRGSLNFYKDLPDYCHFFGSRVIGQHCPMANRLINKYQALLPNKYIFLNESRHWLSVKVFSFR